MSTDKRVIISVWSQILCIPEVRCTDTGLPIPTIVLCSDSVMAGSIGINRNALTFSDKLNILKKKNAQQYKNYQDNL